MKKKISIVIPAYNEEENLDELTKRLQTVMSSADRYDFEVIIVENGSYDNTYAKLLEINRADIRFKVIRLSRNFNSNGGILAGLNYASGDAAVVMCADLQDPPELIMDFIRKWEEGYEVVYGIVQKREGIPIVRKILYSMFYKVFFNLTKKTVPENANDFRLMDRKVYSVINNMKENNKFIRGLVAWTGFRQTGIPFERPPRFAGESKANFPMVLNMAMHGIFSFSSLPLQLATYFGIIVSIISFTILVIELLLFIKYGREVPGFTTIVILILFLFGALFLILGIIGEYISRIYEEVKYRPAFIVNEMIGFKVNAPAYEEVEGHGVIGI
jgi:polyisoprenyl-phosphate glycosyltransferase